MAKIERKYLAHYIDTTIPDTEPGTPVYERIGDDLEEYTPELSATVDKTKNILGETSVKISSYDKSGSVAPYYADKDKKLFARLQGIIDGNLALDKLKTTVVEVKLWEPAAPEGSYPAIMETAYIEVTSYGGDTTGYQIPFTLHYTGEKVEGTFDVSKGTFAPTA